MTKTFWSVKYAIWGADRTSTAWFDNKEEADEFAKKDYRDLPVRHTVRKPESISIYEDLVERTHE